MRKIFRKYSEALSFVNETFKNNAGIEESSIKREKADFIVTRSATDFIYEEKVHDMFVVINKQGQLVAEIGFTDISN